MARKFSWNPKGQGLDLDGTDDADELFGANGNNVIRGFGGNDVLKGGNGNDTLIGGDGDDMLVGQQGADVLSGGAGSDTFKFVNLYDWTDWSGTAPVGMETITDFASEDFLDFRGVSSGAITSMDQISFEAIDGGNIIHVDAGGLDTNDMHVAVLGATPTEANFIFAA